VTGKVDMFVMSNTDRQAIPLEGKNVLFVLVLNRMAYLVNGFCVLPWRGRAK